MTIQEKVTQQQNWVYVTPSNLVDELMMSGWKIHIFGNKTEDSVTIAERMQKVLNKYAMHMKVASSFLYKIAIGIPEDIQYGKAATMYLPPTIFENDKLQEFVDDIIEALGDYGMDGIIYGDKSLGHSIHYRYELKNLIKINEGVPHDIYSFLYRANDGSYNIAGNSDPFEKLKILI